MKKLNIGCGDSWKIHEDFVGMDSYDFGQEYVTDVLGPDGIKQFEDDSHNVVMAEHFLEHFIQSEVKVIFNEVHRILKDSGLFKVVVPHKDHERAYVPDHKSFWVENSFRWLENEEVWPVYGFKRWEIRRITTNDRLDIHCGLKPVR